MALIIEDGTQVVDSNSYVTASEIEAYADARGVTLVTDPEVLATKAMDYLESLTYIGSKVAATQSLQWPRTGAYIDGFELTVTDIPVELKVSQKATALAIDAGYDPLGKVEGRGVIRQKVGSLEVWYDEEGSNISYDRAILASLKKLTSGVGGSSNFLVNRA